MTSHDEQEALAWRLQQRALLTAADSSGGSDGDRLMLADATLLAALAGTRLLTPAERAALAASPLTLRRFRQLSLQARAASAAATAARAVSHTTGAAQVIAADSADVTAALAARVTGADGASVTTADGASVTTADGVNATAAGAASVSAAAAANDAQWAGSTGLLRAASTKPEALAALATDDNFWTLHFVAQEGGWQVILALSAQAPFAARLLGEQPLLRVLDGSGAIVLQGRLDADGECECAWPFATAPAAHFQQHGASFTVQPAAPVVS